MKQFLDCSHPMPQSRPTSHLPSLPHCPFLSILLIIPIILAQGTSPFWQPSINLNAGDQKAINGAPTSPTSFLSSLQTFNVTLIPAFTSMPRVILGTEGYTQYAPPNPSSTVLGYQASIASVSLAGFTTNITVNGVTIVILYFNYLAIQGQATTLYTAYVSQTFSSSSPLANNSAPIRSITQTGTVLMPNTASATYLAYIAGYSIVTYSTGVFVSMNATAYGATQYQVSISTLGTASLQSLTYFLLAFDYAAFTSTYTRLIDLYSFSVFNNVTTSYSPTITNLATQGQFRNNLYGLKHIDYPPIMVSFILNYTSTPANQLLFIGFQVRIRNCSGGYYEPLLQLCYPTCPPYYYVNTTYTYCLACHYSCLQCTAPALSTSCSACSPTDSRTLLGNACPCNPNFYDNSVSRCANCDPTCLSCSSPSSSNCLSCNASLNRVMMVMANVSTCQCASEYYSNVTCMPCPVGCLLCAFSSGVLSCSQCNSSLNRTLLSGGCPCLVGYYENLTCQVCLAGTTACSYNTTTAVLTATQCDPTQHRQLASGACLCQNGYYLLNNACTQCMVGCLACSFLGSETCSSCDTVNLWVANGTACMCSGGFMPHGGLCVSVCGDGLITGKEECDDANTADGDGCSSACGIEQGHQCFSNVSILPYSICYYQEPLSFKYELVEKQPGSNTVLVVMLVSAPNCNRRLLQQYLQNTNSASLTLNDQARLLQQHNIEWHNQDQEVRRLVSTTLHITWISYDPLNSLLTLVFDYDATFSLLDKSLAFSPSAVASTNYSRYFYSSPATTMALQNSYNNLPTVYYSEDSYSSLSLLSKLYMVVMGSLLAFGLIMTLMKRGAVGVQCVLVGQVGAISLLSSGTVDESLAGFLGMVKYSYGYNLLVGPIQYVSRLMSLGVDGNMLNAFNLTAALLILPLLISLACIAILKIKRPQQTVSNHTQAATVFHQAISRQPIRREQHNQHNQPNEQNEVRLDVANNGLPDAFPREQVSGSAWERVDRDTVASVLSYSLQVLMALTLLSAAMFAVILTFISTTSTLVVATVLLMLYFLALSLYYCSCLAVPFNAIPLLSTSFSTAPKNRHHYPILFGGLLLFGLTTSFLPVAAALYSLVAATCLALVVLALKLGLYANRMDDWRSVACSTCVIALMALNLIGEFTDSPLTLSGCRLTVLLADLSASIFFTVRLRGSEKQYQQQQKEGNQQNQKMMQQMRVAGMKIELNTPILQGITRDEVYYSAKASESGKQFLQKIALQLTILKGSHVEQSATTTKDFSLLHEL